MKLKLSKQKQENRRIRGIYLLPNLLTTGGLFAGFYAVVAAMKGLFDLAAIAIFIAMIADNLDGRVARLTNTQSDFGAEYDSISDMVAFGVAPALVVYSWSLINLGKIGWLIAFCYTAAGGLRLARFNVQVTVSKRFFQGLPIPSGAALITSFVWVGNSCGLQGIPIAIVTALVTIFVAILMVSNIRYHSFKEVDFKGKVPFSVLIVVVIIFVCIAVDPPTVLLICFAAYVLSGPLMHIQRLLRQARRRKVE